MNNVQKLTPSELVSLEGGEIIGGYNLRSKGQIQCLPIVPFGDPSGFERLLRWSQ